MAYTQAQYDALQNAMATGALTVRYADGRTVTYRSFDEMKAILDVMAAEMGTIPRKTNYSYAAFRRGHD